MTPLEAINLALALGVTGTLGYGLFHPRSQLFGVTHHRGKPSPEPHAKRIALTFDDGPHPDATPRILDLLAKHNLPATFFVIGRHARKHQAVIQRIVDQGHVIANHSLDHAHLGTLRSRRYWTRQIQTTNDIIFDATGLRPALFRPPMGFRSPLMMLATLGLGMPVVNWSRSARDGVTTTASRIHRRLTRPPARDGDIILLHDGVNPWRRRSWKPTVEALPSVIDHLQQQGLSFTTVDQLLQKPAYHAEASPPTATGKGVL